MYKTFIAFLLLCPLFSLAQSNYKSGYIVDSKGDTTRGLVDYRGWESNPEKIKFKAAKDAVVKELTTDDINAFAVDKKIGYIKYTGKISMDRISDVSVSLNRDTSYRLATVFLKVLQKGKNLMLYSYTDNIKTRYYISEQPAFIPQELVYRLYYDVSRVDHTHGRTVNEDTYAKQLFGFANKYNVLTESLQKDIEQAGYREYYINQVVKQINKGVQ